MFGASLPPDQNNAAALIAFLSDPQSAAKLAKQSDELEARRRSFDQEVHDFFKARDSYNESFDRQREEIEEKTIQLRKLEAQLNNAQSQLNDRIRDVSSQEAVLNAKTQEVNKLHQDLQNKDAEHAAASENLNRQMWLNKTSEDSHNKAKAEYERKLQQLQEIING